MRIRLFLFALLCMLTVVPLSIGFTGTASALSSFDDVIIPTDELYVGDPSECLENYGGYYTTLMSQWEGDGQGGTSNAVVKESFFDALANGGTISVTQVKMPTYINGLYMVEIAWSKTPDLPLTWAYNSGWGRYEARFASNWQVSILVKEELGMDWTGDPCELKLVETALYYPNTPIGYTPDPSYGGRENYFFTGDQNLPSGYAGAGIEVGPAPVKYVALGDSFSSGEGNPPFELGTDEDGVNECHRSFEAYPYVLKSDPGLDLGPYTFEACSGATTDHVLYNQPGSGQWNEPEQVDALSQDTETVTITIGGNDIEFEEFASACVYTNCGSTSDEYLESWDIMADSNRSDYLPDGLADAFSGIATGLTSLNTSAKVYVVGYPYVVTEDVWTSTTNSDPWNCLYMSQASAAGAEAIVTKLNNVIDLAVTAFNDSRFEFVDPTDSGNPFLGHELCRSSSYFNGIEAAAPPNGQNAYVFHPNGDGQRAYGELIADAMN